MFIINDLKRTYFVGDMTSKQKRRSPSLTGLTVQMRKSSSITENESSLLRFLQFESKSLQIVTQQQQHKTIFNSTKQKTYKITENFQIATKDYLIDNTEKLILDKKQKLYNF